MNIILRELYANKKSLLVWSAVMFAFVVMMFAEFAAYYKNPEMMAVIDAMPQGLLEAFGMAGANLTTVSGYLGVSIVFINLTLSVYAMLLGNGIIAKEERDKTAGFSLTLPVTRSRLITGKLVAALSCSLILLTVVAGSIMVAVRPYELEAQFGTFMLLIMGTSFVTMFIFQSLGMLLASLLRRHKISSGMGMGLVFITYLFSILATLSDEVAFLRHLSPFSYFEAQALLRDLRIEPLPLFLSALIITLSLAGTYVSYNKRDLYV